MGSDWGICGSYWSHSGEGVIGPVVLAGPWTDEDDHYGMVISTDPRYIVEGFSGGEDISVSVWNWDHYDYDLEEWVGKSLGLFFESSKNVSLSSLDLGVEREMALSHDTTFAGFVGIKRGTWSADSDLTAADLGGTYDTYPEDYEFNWQRIVKAVNATMFGPAVSVSGHLRKGNLGVGAKVGYAYLPWGNATQTVDRTSARDTYAEGSLISREAGEAYSFEHVFSPSTQVLDLEATVTYRVTENLLAAVGLKKSTWYELPAILHLDEVFWNYEASAGSTSTVSVEGITVGLVYSF
jgi:hypothetical protein